MEPENSDNKPLQTEPVYLFGPSAADEKILCMKPKTWWVVFLALLGGVFVLIIGCLGSPDWMETGQALDSITGGILRCTDCPGAWQDSSYDEISHYICDASDTFSTSLCKLFHDLRDAGAAYVFFELLSLVFLNAWAVTIFMALIGRECFKKARWLGYVHPGLALFWHFLALVIWAGVSQAKFNIDCSWTIIDGSKPAVCASHAVALSITILLLYLVIAGLFYFAYWKSRKSPKNPESPPPPAYANVPPPSQGNPQLELERPVSNQM